MKKTMKKIVSVSVATALAATTLTGAVAADLADLPAPFVQNGVANFQTVFGANAATADVAGAVDIAVQFAQRAVSEVGVGGSTGSTTISGENVALEGTKRGRDGIVFGDAVNDVLDDRDLPVLLRTETITDDNDNDFEYDQVLTMGNSSINFTNPNNRLDGPEVVKIFDGDYAYKLTVRFDDAVNMTRMTDSQTLTLANREFVISPRSTAQDLILFGSDASVTLDYLQPTTVTFPDGRNVEMTILVAMPASGTNPDRIQLEAGGTTRTIKVGDKMSVGGTDLFLQDLVISDFGDRTVVRAKILIGADEVLLRSTGGRVQVDGNDLRGYTVTLPAGEDWANVQSFNLGVNPNRFDDQDARFLRAGNKMVDPLFGTFGLNFVGMSEALDASSKAHFFVRGISSLLEVRFENANGRDSGWFTVLDSGTFDDADFATPGQTRITEDQIFVANDDRSRDRVTSLFEVLSVTTGDEDQDKEVRLRNVMTGSEQTVRHTNTRIQGTNLNINFTTINQTGNVRGFNVDSALPLEWSLNGEHIVNLSLNDSNTTIQYFNVTESSSNLVTLDNTDVSTFLVNVTEYRSSDSEYVIRLHPYPSASVETGQMRNTPRDRKFYSPVGTFALLVEDNDEIHLHLPVRQEVTYQVFIAAQDAVVVTNGGSGPSTAVQVNAIDIGLAIMDDQVTLASAQRNLIVVGGPCANSVARQLLGVSAAECMVYDPDTAEIRLFDLQNGRTAMLVAGAEARDTQAAARAVATFDNRLRGERVTLQVSSASNFQID